MSTSDNLNGQKPLSNGQPTRSPDGAVEDEVVKVEADNPLPREHSLPSPLSIFVPPSISVAQGSAENKPVIHRINATGSVQALIVDDDILIAGLQGGDIVAWSLETYSLLVRIHAHQGSVLGLSLSDDKSLLFSSGQDSIVNVWSTQTFARLYSFYSPYEVGDIFCAVHSSRKRTIFCGAQNASIQWHQLPDESNLTLVRSQSSPGSRRHRFFDSLGPGGSINQSSQTDGVNDDTANHGGQQLAFSKRNYSAYAHKSYIYCMILAKGLLGIDSEEEVLISAGGGGTIKIWGINDLQSEVPRLVQLEQFKNKDASVFSIACKGYLLYAGLSNGVTHVYNVASMQLVQKLPVGHGDVNQIQVLDGITLCGTAEGWVKVSEHTIVCGIRSLYLSNSTTTSRRLPHGRHTMAKSWPLESRKMLTR